ncbi:MAG: hypothetical protein CM15mP77_2400 [Synechococcus sp.]|nr:MAG: hypothetical protein CM15mP77_2400 [Synechococcus sp.]
MRAGPGPLLLQVLGPKTGFNKGESLAGLVPPPPDRDGGGGGLAGWHHSLIWPCPSMDWGWRWIAVGAPGIFRASARRGVLQLLFAPWRPGGSWVPLQPKP